MLKILRFPILSLLVFLSAASVFTQNKFEGYNLLLDATDNQTQQMCALRYVAADDGVIVTDLDRSTPMKLTPCDQTTRITSRSASASALTARETDRRWCFTGEDKRYRISFKGDLDNGQITYDWIATPATPGVYNIKDFGAIGDGKTDDTAAFKNAMAFVASRNGGTLNIPEGDFVVSSPVTLPPGLKMQGISGLTTLAPTNNQKRESPSRIKLRGTNRALFKIGECTENISIHDVELFAESNTGTVGIEAVGAFLSSQSFYFERVGFQEFNRGFYAHGLPVNGYAWQFDFIKFNHCRFVYNRDAAIYSNTSNSSWKIEGTSFINPKRTATERGDSMRFDRAGMILIQDCFGGGFPTALGGTFIDILDSAATTIINSQTEAMTNSIVYNGNLVPNAGDYSYPITLVNNIFEHPIIFKARRTFVSTGNLYGHDTFQADERLRVYSTGDRFCYDGYTLKCRGAASSKNFDRATVIFMTAQPEEGSVKGNPTFFGTDVQFGAPPQMPSFLQNALPSGKPNGAMVYCSNCRRNATPCQAGGTGAPAMLVAGQWSCL